MESLLENLLLLGSKGQPGVAILDRMRRAGLLDDAAWPVVVLAAVVVGVGVVGTFVVAVGAVTHLLHRAQSFRLGAAGLWLSRRSEARTTRTCYSTLHQSLYVHAGKRNML